MRLFINEVPQCCDSLSLCVCARARAFAQMGTIAFASTHQSSPGLPSATGFSNSSSCVLIASSSSSSSSSSSTKSFSPTAITYLLRRIHM